LPVGAKTSAARLGLPNATPPRLAASQEYLKCEYFGYLKILPAIDTKGAGSALRPRPEWFAILRD